MSGNKIYKLVVIGGSAGSLSILLKILPVLKLEMGLAVIIVLHRKLTEEETLIDLLSARTRYRVKEVDDKDDVTPGVVYVAPADYHVLVEKDYTLSLDTSEKINYSRPSIDVTFESAAEVYGDRMVCILLSGANSDGAIGLSNARKAGALVVVQDPNAAEFPMMPEYALAKVPVDLLLHNNNLAGLTQLLEGN